MGNSFGWLTNPVENPWSETALKSPMCSNKVVIKGKLKYVLGWENLNTSSIQASIRTDTVLCVRKSTSFLFSNFEQKGTVTRK